MGNDGELSVGLILARMDKSTTNPYRSYKVFFDFLISFCVICTFVISHWRFYKEMQNPFFLSKPNLAFFSVPGYVFKYKRALGGSSVLQKN